MRRSWLILTAATTWAVVPVLAAGTGTATALSCAPHPDGSPRAIASGTEDLSTRDRFFDRYDFAVLGTVTGIATVGEGHPDYGVTRVTVDVTAVLGRDTAPAAVELSSPDPGWLAGYPFQVGTGYVIPVQVAGPRGEPNYSFVCDPITATADIGGLADELGVLARAAGIPFSTSTGRTVASGHHDDRDSVGGAAVAAASWRDTRGPAILAAVALALVVATVRRAGQPLLIGGGGRPTPIWPPGSGVPGPPARILADSGPDRR
jgi:hypothetical protein